MTRSSGRRVRRRSRSARLVSWLAVLGLLASLATGGCSKRTAEPGVRARFGIFFGGDVQEREELPLVLDRSRQSHGIRLDFDDPPSEPLRVTWEIEKPGGGKDGGGGLVDYGEVKTRAGARTLDVPLAFRPGDKPGRWHVRVSLEDKQLLDRAFRVVPAAAGSPPVVE